MSAYKYEGHGAIHIDKNCPGTPHGKYKREPLSPQKVKELLKVKEHRYCLRCNPKL